jgi:TolA-binding protein
MRKEYLRSAVLIAATLIVAPAAMWASPKAGGSVTPSGEPNDVSLLLEKMRSDAYNVKNQADQLEALLRNGPLNSWQTDATLLTDMADGVNEMNHTLARLRSEESEASPLQQKIIDRVTLSSIELAGTTQAAITTLNDTKSYVYMSSLSALADQMYNEANRVNQTVGNLDKYLRARQEASQFSQKLQLNNNPQSAEGPRMSH